MAISAQGPRVLYIIDSLSRAGAEQSLVSMAPHLLREGIDLEVAYLRDRDGLLAELRDSGVVTHAVTSPRTRGSRIVALRQLIRSRAPDLVHTTLFESDIAGRVAARLARTPSVSSLVNVAYGASQLQDSRINAARLKAAHWADEMTARLPVRFHALTEHVAEIMSEELSIPRSRIDVIPRGRDVATLGVASHARRTRIRSMLRLSADDLVLLAASRHEYQKGLDVLLAAFPSIIKSHPTVRLLIAGREGNMTSTLQSMIKAIGIGNRVQVLGARSDVPDLIVASDILVLPSRWEGFGGVLLEAMGLGTPIVATDLPPVREVTGNAAWLCRPDDPSALAEAIDRCITFADLASEKISYGAKRFQNVFSVEKVAARMSLFYLSTTASHRAPPMVSR